MSQRKYESDGHPQPATKDEIQIGAIIRRVASDRGVSPFSDTVVIGIISSGTYKNMWKDTWYTTAADISATVNNSDVMITVARPYLFASTMGCCPNWLQGVEKFTIALSDIISNYSVVEMSNGMVANYNSR